MSFTPLGSKAAPRPGGIGSAAQPGQQPAEGENVLSKILQGGAAEQAGKLGDGRIKGRLIQIQKLTDYGWDYPSYLAHTLLENDFSA